MITLPERIRRWVLLLAAALWIAALFGFASGYLSDDPPAESPYSSAPAPLELTADS